MLFVSVGSFNVVITEYHASQRQISTIAPKKGGNNTVV